jgi:hypothetical protein
VTPEPGGAIRGSMKNQIYRVGLTWYVRLANTATWFNGMSAEAIGLLRECHGQYGMPIGIDERIGAFLAHVEDRP